MQQKSGNQLAGYNHPIALILVLFFLSRVLVYFSGIHMKFDALSLYWQYLNVETLKHHLLTGLWYDHAQPPGFNLLLSCILKIFGDNAPIAFELIFKGISLVNVLLLYHILRRLIPSGNIPLILSLLYLLSPALLILEAELFYTTVVSFYLLTSVFFIQRLNDKNKFAIWGTCLPLTALCLTRSLYHFLWLTAIFGLLIFFNSRKPCLKHLIVDTSICFFLAISWYTKNYIVFGKFSSSSWIGMNFARTVFYNNPITDSSRIEAYEPFSAIPVYRPFIKGDAERRFAGRDDRDLLQELKTDSSLNENHIAYIEISDQYMKVSKEQIRAHPFNYVTNAAKAAIIFFAPATRYSYAEPQAKKIKYYDLFYSFNLTHFATGLQQRRIALTLSAIPKIAIYLITIFLLVQSAIRQRKISLLNAVILVTVFFIFTVSSLIEHYENMRFRYEIEPLFLILLAQVWNNSRQKKIVNP